MTHRVTPILNRMFGARLAESTLQILRQAAERHSYPAGTVLCRQGEVGDKFFVILDGRVVTTQVWEDGQERILSLLRSGEYFGEMALIDNSPRMATCTAVTPVTLLEITEADFDRLVEHSPAVAYAILQRVLATMRQMDELAISDLRAKNEELRVAYADLQAAQAELVEKERLERELELAAEMQRSLLPGELPLLPGYRFAAYLQPARLVGGDLYDVIPLDDGEHVAFLLADVSDKGLHAALFMAVAHTLFRREARFSLSPAAVAVAVHRGMLDVASTNDVFVTAFYGVLHCPSGRLTYVRAAQERPLLARPGEPVRTLPGNGRFLGMLPELTLQEQSVQLRPGDRLLVFSDGAPDAPNEQEEPYGHARLTAAFATASSLPVEQITAHIVADVARWTQTTAAFDDLTLLAVEVTHP